MPEGGKQITQKPVEYYWAPEKQGTGKKKKIKQVNTGGKDK